MKLREICRFELAYQIRRVWTWLFFAVPVAFAFLMTRNAALEEALREDFFLNSPFAIAKVTIVGCLLWLLVAAAVAGEAAARDVVTGLYPLTYTTPLGKAEYLGGRFFAAFVLNVSIMLAVQAAILAAVYAPGVQPEVVGPFRLAGYLTAFAFIALPNAFVATALQFSLAARSGRPMTAYLGSVLLFFMAYVVSLVIMQLGGRPDIARLTDPLGVVMVLTEVPLGWTPAERNTRLLEFEGSLLWNRLLWIGVGLLLLVITHLRFRFAHRTESGWWRRWTRRAAATSPRHPGIAIAASTAIAVPQVRRRLGFGTRVRQTLAVASTSFRTIAKSWAGLALLVVLPLLTVPVLLDQMSLNGVPLVPTTAHVLRELTAPLAAELSRWVIVPLLIVVYAGELVWRERDAGLDELTDATPVSEWVPLLGKILGLALLLVAFLSLQAAAGMFAQTILGHDELEVGLYLKVLFGLQLPEYLLFAVLAVVVHVLADQKYVAHLVATVAYAFIALASLFRIEHNLLVYGGGPAWSYTEMRGFGPFLGPWAWFKLYWAAWALLLAVTATLLWVRGKERGLAVRLQLARRRLTPATARVAATAVALILTVGGWIFYNTNVLNAYASAAKRTERSAEYERRYRQYERIPQPRLERASLRIEIHPERRGVEIRGTYGLVNRSRAAIDSLHVATVPGVATGAFAFDRPAKLAVADDERGHRIYALAKPLQPGEALRLDFAVHVAPRGFRNRGADDAVVANGTHFTNREWLPAIGYQREREVASARDRRAHGLGPRPAIVPSLDDVEERLGRPGSGPVVFEAVLGTDADQVAVAPGALRRTWTDGGRRYFHYATSAPIGNEWEFFSADYVVHEARWKDVAIRVFHDPRHTAHLDRTVRSIGASLDYYSEQLGPYPYGHLSVVERPGLGAGMHAEPSMISHQEGFCFWQPKDDPGSLDLPFAVVAHEMAHQWTVPYAAVEGAPFLSEGLAWYSAMQVVKESRGPGELRRLLHFMRQPYPFPPIRHGEPLLRAVDPYLAYRKGPFAMYALSEYVGAERVNAALRRLVATHRSGAAPPATTLDLYRELRAVTPDSFRPLLHDLFEVNTVWQLETERVTAKQMGGSWQVTLDVKARKVVSDSAGVETEAAMNDWVQIGVFAPGKEGDELGEPLYVQLHRIRSGAQTIVVTVPRQPDLAGIDPYHLLDLAELDDDDNVEAVEISS